MIIGGVGMGMSMMFIAIIMKTKGKFLFTALTHGEVHSKVLS